VLLDGAILGVAQTRTNIIKVKSNGNAWT